MTAVAAYRLRLAFGLVLAFCTVGLAVALAGPVSMPLSSWDPPVRMVAVTEGRAVAAAAKNPPDLEAVERLTRQTLAEKPGDAAAWARLAWSVGAAAGASRSMSCIPPSPTSAWPGGVGAASCAATRVLEPFARSWARQRGGHCRRLRASGWTD